MTDRTRAPQGAADIVRACLLAGLLVGVVLGAASWLYDVSRNEGGLDLAHHGGLRVLFTTLAGFAVMHAVLGAVLGGLAAGIGRIAGRAPSAPTAGLAVFAIGIGTYVFAYRLVAANLHLPAYVPLEDPLRAASLTTSLLVGLCAGVGGTVVLAALRSRIFNPTLLRTSVGIAGVLAAAVAVAAVGGGGARSAAPAAQSSAGGSAGESGAGGNQQGAAGKVVVIGVDGGSWQLVERMAADGLLPTIARLRADGIATNLMTHGKRLSPAVWTGIATGWSHARHGVMGFTVPVPSEGRSRVVQSVDRRKAALWQVATERDRSALVINWWASYPAESIDGVIVSRIVDMDDASVSPPARLEEARAIVEAARERGEADAALERGAAGAGAAAAASGRFAGEVEALFDLTEHFTETDAPDLTMLYVQSTDKAQHKFWGGYEPERFGEEWDLAEEYVESGREVILDVWTRVDRRLGRLLEKLGDDTTVLVISDHGFKPTAMPLVLPRTNDLLHAAGHLAWSERGAPDIDYRRTLAFTADGDAADPMIGIYVNAYEPVGQSTFDAGEKRVLAERVAADLAALRVVETGEPLFLETGVVADDGPRHLRELGFDVYARKAPAVRVVAEGKSVVVGGAERELGEFLDVYTDVTGNHDPRGILIAAGPGVSTGVAVRAVADSPYTTALNYVTGYKPRLEPLYRALRAAGVLDPYTTIDVAPTVLALLGLPVAADMEGRIMTSLLDPSLRGRVPAEIVATFDHLVSSASVAADGDSDDTMQQLKALGYIQ